MKPFASERQLFPDPRLAGRDGLVMVGGDLKVDTLVEAYSFGIFPWPQEGLPLLWFSPSQRGVLDFGDLHISRSFKKFLAKTKWQVRWNSAFAQVIRACAQVPRPGQEGTWITPAIEKAYIQFHRAGYAHSVECWEGDHLIGGLYGIFVAGVFAGESMFYLKANASKLCLWHTIEELRGQGFTWMDTQMVTTGLKSWGGKYILRRDFLRRLEVAKAKSRSFTPPT